MNRSSDSPYKTAYIRRRARESIFRGRGIVLTDGGGNQKVVQRNIIALLDGAGGVVVQYVYDAWGNHAVLDSNGNDLTDSSHIGNRNPIRYRGYFYDVETGLYYLQTRYYDPEIGRFLNMDDVSYADPEQFHGLNLYAYCGNDPVNNVDPTGHFPLLIALFLGAFTVAGAVTGGIVGHQQGKTGWSLVGSIFLGGAMGLAAGGLVMTIIGAGVAVFSSAGLSASILGVTAGKMVAYGMLAYDFVSLFVAPIVGLSMEVLEWTDTYTPEKPKENDKSFFKNRDSSKSTEIFAGFMFGKSSKE